MPTRPIDICLPAHFVVFRYRDVPKEWHVTCLESCAFGSGPTVDAAFAHLLKTLSAQFQEAADEGFDAVFKGAADPEWTTAYAEGKHPILDDVLVAISVEGEVSIVMTPKVRARLSGAVRVDTTGASRGNLQPGCGSSRRFPAGMLFGSNIFTLHRGAVRRAYRRFGFSPEQFYGQL